ncbi:hypothetical protein RHMOL_Rhmol01G0228600 [Rhododendron molle]|uniref:Uncharacterized protein n=1 Tax=Rhododendron molle TaxID=49168 RepID=A0ACC0Q699_RHOML|nr:hypothetical protein RHMOL_Rhmol01G0228600 [Rhododendron molle]
MAESGGGSGVSSSTGGDGGHATEGGDGGDWRAPVDQGSTLVTTGLGGPQIGRLDPRSSVEGLVIAGMGSTGASGSGSGGSSDGDGQMGQLPRDPTSGKAPMVKEEAPRAAHVELVEFIPPMGLSDHEPIMSSDLAEFVGMASLARLMRESPEVVEAVMAAREERLKEITLHNEEERLRREEDIRAREAEPTERAQEEGPWTYKVAVTLADSIRRMPRHRFVVETYIPPEPYVVIPSGAKSYLPSRSEYDAEQVLRDPDQHLSRTWAQVPIEWAREVARLMLAMEKEFNKIASGTPLQLHYPPAAPAPAIQPQGQASAQHGVEIRDEP